MNYFKLIIAGAVGIFMSACTINQTPARITETKLIEVNANSDSILHEEMHNLIEPYKKQKNSEMGEIIGSCDHILLRDHYTREPNILPRTNTPLGNLVADMMLETVRLTMEADMAITNLGGIRRDLYEGNITLGDIYEILPFDNKLVVLTLKGSDLVDLFKAVYNKGGEPISGATLVPIEHIENILVNGKEVSNDSTYKIVTTDYLSWGNDQLQPLAKYIEIKSLNLNMRDAMIDWVKAKTANGENISAEPDSRVTMEIKSK